MPAAPSLLIVPYRSKTGRLYSQIPVPVAPATTGAGDFNVTRATEATRVNSAGLIESVASGIPRLDYFASGGVVGCPALLVEPAATNQIRNNSMVGAATGTPGTLPTNWAINLAGLSQEVVGVGVENGVEYFDLRLFGTAGGGQVDYRYDGTTQIAAASGQIWTHSFFFKIIAEPQPPLTYTHQIIERNAGGGLVADTSTNFAATTSLTRFQVTRTLNNANTAFVQPQIRHSLTSGSTYDFTVRIGYPQMELGSVATSVIPTTTAALTRNADVISVSGAVSGSIGATEGTIYAEVAYSAIATTKTIVAITDGTGNNRIAIRLNSTTLISAVVVVAGTSYPFDQAISAIPTSGTFKIALAYSANDYVFAFNGTTYASTATRPVPATNAITIGNNGFNADFFNDRIRAVALYPTRLTDTELQALTT